jgi:hypothetical protein
MKILKKKIKRISILTILFFTLQILLPIPYNFGTQTLESWIMGDVKASDTGKPIPLVTVVGVKIENEKLTNEIYSCTTNSAGVYLLSQLKPGNYLVYVYSETGYSSSLPKQIYVPAGRTGLNPVVLDFILDKGSAISGRVYNREGIPQENAVVTITSDNDFKIVKTDANGDYIIKGLKPNKDYKIFAGINSQSFATKNITTSPAGEIIQNIEFTLGSEQTKVTGTVTENGIPISDVTIRFYGEESSGVGKTNTEGKYSISGLKGGVYIAIVEKEGYETNILGNIEIKDNEEKTINFILTKSIGQNLDKNKKQISTKIHNEYFPSLLLLGTTPVYAQAQIALPVLAAIFTLLAVTVIVLKEFVPHTVNTLTLQGYEIKSITYFKLGCVIVAGICKAIEEARIEAEKEEEKCACFLEEYEEDEISKGWFWCYYVCWSTFGRDLGSKRIFRRGGCPDIISIPCP